MPRTRFAGALSLLLFLLWPALPARPEAPADGAAGQPSPEAPVSGDEGMRNIQASLHDVFEVEPFAMTTRPCGRPQTFVEGDGLVLCQDLGFGLAEVMGDQTLATSFTFFLILHQFGHITMKEWGDPEFGDEDRADRFATAVMIMSKQRQDLRNAARYLTRVRSKRAILDNAFAGDRHWLDTERMQQVYDWSANDDVMRSWHGELIPHMTKKTLKNLRLAPPGWADTGLLDAEISKRDIEL
jgi:hypothetical protein